MKQLLIWGVSQVARVHNYIASLNNAYEMNFSDKDLHFLVFGLLGLGMVFVVYPLFKYLAKQNKIMAITWIYVTTLMVVITFAIEIGQKLTNTGDMDFADVVYGLAGYMAMFLAFLALRWIYRRILHFIRQYRRKQK